MTHTIQELQAEIQRKDKAFHDMVTDTMYLKEDLRAAKEQVEFWKNQHAAMERRLVELTDEAQHHEIIVNRLEAERNALIEVIKIQAGGKNGTQERDSHYGHGSGGVSPNPEVPPDRPSPIRSAPTGDVPGEGGST